MINTLSGTPMISYVALMNTINQIITPSPQNIVPGNLQRFLNVDYPEARLKKLSILSKNKKAGH
jgi:hypothetical protein